MRIRQVLPNLDLGKFAPGPLNSLTDVPGVQVHTQEIFGGEGSINTGVTSILPREVWSTSACYAGVFSFNGASELTGAHALQETGLLCSPIVLTGTFGVGASHQGIYQYAVKALGAENVMLLPVVGETYDGYLHDCSSFAVKPEHIIHGLENVTGKVAVREGNVGGGVGMICHGLKGGTGSSSRVLPGGYIIAALVQANYGKLSDLRISGVPVGRVLAEQNTLDPSRRSAQEHISQAKDRKDGSIIVVLATDAPLHPAQLQRIAKRATVGLARVGGQGHHLSGDIFLAFSTFNEISVNQAQANASNVPRASPTLLRIDVMEDSALNNLFEATADVVEKAIYNAICMAETLVGYKGHTAEELPLAQVKEIMSQYGRG